MTAISFCHYVIFQIYNSNKNTSQRYKQNLHPDPFFFQNKNKMIELLNVKHDSRVCCFSGYYLKNYYYIYIYVGWTLQCYLHCYKYAPR